MEGGTVLVKPLINVRLVCTFLVCILQWSCSANRELTKEHMEKLHPQLRLVLSNPSVNVPNLDVSERADGEKEYGVIIRCANIDELRAAGIPVASVMRDLVTARLTRRELMAAARLASVQSIEPATQNFPHER
jgi:hypothetical protein